MTKELRQRHLVTWCILMLALPAGIISARLATPAMPVSDLQQPVSTVPLPVILLEAHHDNWTARIRQGADTMLQLEWISNASLQWPTAVIYMNDGVSRSMLIGSISSAGTYHFPLPASAFSGWPPKAPIRLTLFDFIHETVIDSLVLH